MQVSLFGACCDVMFLCTAVAMHCCCDAFVVLLVMISSFKGNSRKDGAGWYNLFMFLAPQWQRLQSVAWQEGRRLYGNSGKFDD